MIAELVDALSKACIGLGLTGLILAVLANTSGGQGGLTSTDEDSSDERSSTDRTAEATGEKAEFTPEATV